jgi:hypothetical protein
LSLQVVLRRCYRPIGPSAFSPSFPLTSAGKAVKMMAVSTAVDETRQTRPSPLAANRRMPDIYDGPSLL